MSRTDIFALKRRLNKRDRHVEDVLTSISSQTTASVRRLGNWIKYRLRPGDRCDPSFSIDADEYERWVRAYSSIDASLRARLAARVGELTARPLISVIMPSYNIDPRWMREAIESVRRQIYPHWELCISDDASTLEGVHDLLKQAAAGDTRIRVAFRPTDGHMSANSNSALDLATGDYLALMDTDGLLSEDALFCVAREIAVYPDVDLIFSDEDKIDAAGRRFDPFFKPAWNPALMLSQNGFSHLGVFRRTLVEKVGRFREGYEGAQDHDLVLRCAEATVPERIRHIPRILYHWRALSHSAAAGPESKPYALVAGSRAIEDHLRRRGIKGHVDLVARSFYQVAYDLPDSAPLVSVIVPTTLRGKIVARCLGSLLDDTEYPDFEFLILATEEDLAVGRTHRRIARILDDARVRTVAHTSVPFNFSVVNNIGAAEARGELLCFLNDDVEVMSKDWLAQLVARVTLTGVGASGPMLYYPSGQIQQAGVLLGIGGVAAHAFRNMPRRRIGYFGRSALEQDYTCLTAACLLVRRELFEAVGGFDMELPAAFNDIDLCIRMRHAGARIVWTPTAKMYHHESLTYGHPDAARRAKQFDRDVEVMRGRWAGILDNDPAYNPNLSLDPRYQFSLSAQPRTLTTLTDGAPGCAREALSRTFVLAKMPSPGLRELGASRRSTVRGTLSRSGRETGEPCMR